MRCPVWQGTDFTQCFRQTVLDTALPLSIVALSILVLVAHKIHAVRQRKASEQQVAKLDPAASNVFIPNASNLDPHAPTNASHLSVAEQSIEAMSPAARQVFETENAVILNEVQSTPEDPVGPTEGANMRRLELVRCVVEITGAVTLVGLHTAAWAFYDLGRAAPAGGLSFSWELVWAWVWSYFAILSYWTLTTPARLYEHKVVIQATYFLVTLINLRWLLLSRDDYPSNQTHVIVVLTSLQLVVSALLGLPSLFFPMRSKLPQHVRAIYRTMRAERKHGMPGTAVPTPRRRRSRQHAANLDLDTDLDTEDLSGDSDEEQAEDVRNAILRASRALEHGPDLTAVEAHKAPISPELTASLYSRLLFSFMTPELTQHFRHQYTIDEVPEMKPEDSAAAVVSYFRSSSGSSSKSESSAQTQRSLPLRLLIHFWPELSYQLVTSFIQGLASIAAPLGTQYILAFIKLRYRKSHDPSWTPDDGEVYIHMGILYAVLMFCGSLAFSVLASQALMTGRKICCQIRAILITEIMTKALRRSALGGAAPSSSSEDEDEDEDRSSKGEPEEAATGRATDGQVVNLISVDVFKVSEVCAYLHFIFPQAPTEVVLSLYFLVRLIGWSAIIGLLTVVVMMPIEFYLSAWFLDAQKDLLGVTDKRLDLTTEVLQAMKTVKFFAWEASFSERLNKIRNVELSVLRRRVVLMMLQLVSFRATPVLTTVVVFAVHTQVFHRPLSAEVAFASLAYFALLKDGLETIPNQLPSVLGALVSVRRINQYLEEDETTKYDQLLDFNDFGPQSHPYVGFKNASFTYASDEQLAENTAFVLKDLSINFPPGLSIIVGPVGSGKSSLLLSLLGETRRLKGKNYLPAPIARALVPIEEDGLSDTVAYATQTPWLLGTSVKENILFGLPFDEARYKAVLRACALETDLKILEYHDETEVGEKGTALSGGQKARIALARCLYSTARVLLIDDALSALDSSTSEYIYKHYLRGSLVKGRTIIMVTHAVPLCMPGASLVVALDGGKIVAQGPPEKVLSSGLFRNEIQELVKEDTEKHNLPPTIEVLDEGQRRQEAAELKKKLDKKAQFAEEETIAQGAVKLKSYMLYFANFGSNSTLVALLWGTVFVLYFAAQGSNIAATAWLKKWASRDDMAEKSGIEMMNLYSPSLRAVASPENLAHPPMYHVPDAVYARGTVDHAQALGQLSLGTQSKWDDMDESTRYLLVYASLSLLYITLDGIKQLVALSGSVIASGRIYRKLLKAILDATPGFFDRTPVGRIMNRMSKDLEGVDQDCSADLMFLADMVIQTVAILGIVTWGVPKFAFLTIFVFIGYGWIGALYLNSSRDLKRLESVQRSPIYTLIGEILSGNVLIRAYGDAGRFTRHCIRLIDRANKPFYALWLANRWLQLRVDALAALITLVLSIFLIVSPDIDAALAGFVLSYAIMLVNCVLWVVRVYSMCEINLSSLERIDEYLELPSERLGGVQPPAYWPSDKGDIVIDHLGARYSPEFPPVLNDVSITIKAGEKVGICGRTGSGKSSLLLTIFRFLEAEQGKILIDGVDIAKVPLATLRKRLTIIPQQADIFQGTVRSNLDPFNEYQDVELWNALERCRLVSHAEVLAATGRPSTSSAPAPAPAAVAAEADAAETEATEEEETGGAVTITSLDMAVHQGGTNFSQGQRQLLALTRGLLKLRDSRILILDESTASLDAETDAQLQETIRSELGSATLLTVAHRLRTIADYSKVLVLDKGKVLEFASPYELLQDPKSSFHDLAQRSGEFDLLFGMAKAASEKETSRS